MNSLFTIKQLTSIQWQALLPLIILSLTGIVTLITSTFEKAKSYGINFILFFIGLLITAASFIWMLPTTSPVSILNGVILVDSYTQIFAVSMIAITLLIALVEFQTKKDYRMPTEVYPLLCFSLVGAIILSSSTDLMMLFIAMELMTYSVYIMVTMNRTSKFSTEAGLKYFILGCTASAVLFYGATLIFGSTGSFNLTAIGELLKGGLEFSQVLSLGFLLFFLGTLFKVGSSPLHVWVPDVYTGAANTITSFMMTIIKFASFAFLIRIFLSLEASGLMQYQDKLYYLFLVGSILSLLSGNLVGLLQSDFKRLLSYSSIGHTGFILIGLVCAMKGSESGYQIAISYLLYYMVASVGIMAVIKVVNPDNTHSFELKDFGGLYKRSPFLAVAATLFLLSLAGFPPLAGFFGKYFVIIGALEASQYALAVIAIISSIIGMAMYLKPVRIIFFSDEDPEGSSKTEAQGLTLLTIWVCLILSFILPYFI